jgi:hypothetical protein
VRLGIVEKFTAEEVCLLWSAIVGANITSVDRFTLTLGVPVGSAKSVERQVDLAFGIFTEKLATTVEDGAAPEGASVAATAKPTAPRQDTVVYPWKDAKEAGAGRVKQLEMENLHLKQLVGNLSLEKKLLLERLTQLQAPT